MSTEIDPVEAMHAARAKAKAGRDAQQAQAQAEREARHSEARAAYRDQMRQEYDGDTATFDRVVWPELAKAWELAQMTDPTEANKARRLERAAR